MTTSRAAGTGRAGCASVQPASCSSISMLRIISSRRSRARRMACRSPASSMIVNWPPRCSRNSVEPAQHASRIDPACPAARASSGVNTANLERREQVDDPPPLLLGKKARKLRVGAVERHPDGDRFAMPQPVTRSAARACAPPSGRSRADAKIPARTDRRPWRCAAGAGPPNAGRCAPSRPCRG